MKLARAASPDVAAAPLRAGDLVMYGLPVIQHVALDTGGGMIIDASTYGKPVAMRYGDAIAGAVRPS